MWFSVGLEERSVRSDMWSGTPLCVEDLTLCCGEEEDFFSWRGQGIIVIVMWGGINVPGNKGHMALLR